MDETILELLKQHRELTAERFELHPRLEAMQARYDEIRVELAGIESRLALVEQGEEVEAA